MKKLSLAAQVGARTFDLSNLLLAQRADFTSVNMWTLEYYSGTNRLVYNCERSVLELFRWPVAAAASQSEFLSFVLKHPCPSQSVFSWPPLTFRLCFKFRYPAPIGIHMSCCYGILCPTVASGSGFPKVSPSAKQSAHQFSHGRPWAILGFVFSFAAYMHPNVCHGVHVTYSEDSRACVHSFQHQYAW